MRGGMLDRSVTEMKNVGKARAEALARLGVEKIGDLVTLYPRAYENRGDIKLLSETVDGEKQALCLVIATQPKRALIKRGMTLLKFRAYDESGVAEITYFNQDYLADKFHLGEIFRFYGRVERKKMPSGKDSFSLSSPIPELVKSVPAELPALIPIYPLTASLTQNMLSKLVSEALSFLPRTADDPLPEDILKKNGLPSRLFALKNIHAPQCMSDLQAAKKRLVYEELFLFSLGVAISGRKRKRAKGAMPCTDGDISPLEAQLPYSLTNAQKRAIAEIRADMAKDEPMSRLLVGDVGSGKTVCAAAAMLIAVKNGVQAALMAPTEILAFQHFADLAPVFEKLGIRCALLTGSVTVSEKRRIYASLAETDPEKRTDIVIGTHALISEGVVFYSLGLVVTDEQHRFGVRQRNALGEKGKNVHTLVMSATPIPRSLALTFYGDLDISLIDEMPPGRQRVDTFTVDESYRERLMGFIKKLTDEGGQVYAVCPAVEEKESEKADEEGDIPMEEIGSEALLDSLFEEKKNTPPLKSAVNYAHELSERFTDKKVAFVHGKMKASEKDAVMRSFASGETDILVSTTVIEVGVNVPNACLMIVENAERFGLSQLHQLRGRVGRGSRKSYCVLVSDSKGEKARARLETMKRMYDGFAIAEKDLEMRGPGDFIGKAAGGVRQSGSLRFKLADTCCDAEVFKLAIDDARELLDSDPELAKHEGLLSEVRDMFDLEGGY